MFARIGKAIENFPKAAMFDLYERGYTSLFEQLVACIISIRTLDETTIPVALRLFAKARTPKAVARLSEDELTTLLYGTTFPGQKAQTIHGIARAALKEENDELPASFDSLISLKGVGPKCANLTLGVAAGVPAISVDIHVHRVTNRWGLVKTPTPEVTMKALSEIVPEQRWIDVNRLLMPFGKHICTGRLPHCSTCPVAEWCLRVGVTDFR